MSHSRLTLLFVLYLEYDFADGGFGYRIRLQSRLVNMDVVYVYLLFLVVFTLVIDYGLRVLRRRLFPTYAQEVGGQAGIAHSPRYPNRRH